MITIFTKQKYLSLRLDNNLSSRQASRLSGISRTTGDKYWKKYQEEITCLAKDKRCLPVIIVDECQLLKQEILRDLVLLMNCEMDSRDN